MAEIDVERKYGRAWPWVLGLILLALLILALAERLAPDEPEAAAVMTEPVATAPVVTPATTPGPIAQGGLCMAQVLSAPTAYIGQNLGTCEMRVVEVVSDRGFWIEENGQRVFVVINEGVPGVADTQGHADERPDINAGQTVNISEAMVLDNVANLARPLDNQTQQVAQQQPWFLAIDEENVSVLTGATP